MAKKQKPLKRTPLKRTPLKKKEYNPNDFKNKENSNENSKKPIPLKRTPLKRTPLKRKEYNADDYNNKNKSNENPKKTIPLKRTPLKQTPLKRKEYNAEDFKSKENSNENPKKPIPLKPTPSKRKEYSSEDFKNKENLKEDSNDKPKKEYPKKIYKKREYKVKDYIEYKKREPKPFVELTTKEAFLKLAAFCAYQERCYQEIYAKLEEWKIPQDDHYAIVTLLEEEKFLNEKRFAESYTRGKFSYKKWGKRKIRYGLLQKNISSTMIQDAFFSEIEDKDYFATLTELLETKWSDLLETEDDNFKRKVKATNYALQKGYENELIREILEGISKL